MYLLLHEYPGAPLKRTTPTFSSPNFTISNPQKTVFYNPLHNMVQRCEFQQYPYDTHEHFPIFALRSAVLMIISPTIF